MEAICAICTNNYLPYAKTVYSSLRRAGNKYPFFLLVFDHDYADIRGFEDINAVKISDLNIDDVLIYLKKYSSFEMSTFLRPFFYEYLLAKRGVEKLIYLDSDVYVTGDFSGIFHQLDTANIVLTPHIADYDRHAENPLYSHYLRLFMHGIYNTGLYGFRNAPETYRFLKWHEDKAKNYFFNDCKHFMYGDQKWIDLVPLYFRGVSVYNGKEVNVANWNLHERKVEYKDGKYYIEGVPMVFFHFSTFVAEKNPMHLSRFADRDVDLSLFENKAYKVLADEYVEMLYENGYEEYRRKPYGYIHLVKEKRKKRPLIKRIVSGHFMRKMHLG